MEDADGTEFLKALNEACDAAEQASPVPTVEQLKLEFLDQGGWPGVIMEQQHHLRSDLTHFLGKCLDGRLAQMATDAQEEMLNKVMEDQLAQAVAIPGQENLDPQTRLRALSHQMNEDSQPNLSAALDYMLSFKFSYQSHFHYRVRKAMDPLDPMVPAGQISPPGQSIDDAGRVEGILRERYREVVTSKVDPILWTKNERSFATPV
jgi:hypothetical protein